MNQDLKNLRGNGDVLCPGDILKLPKVKAPGAKVRASSKNTYRAEIPLMDFAVHLDDVDGPLAKEPFEVRGLPAGAGPSHGTTDDAGSATLRIPVTQRIVVLYLPKRRTLLRVRVGDMDPTDERAGVIKRLMNHGIVDRNVDPRRVDLAAALREFQRRRGLEPTGLVDAATVAALDEPNP